MRHVNGTKLIIAALVATLGALIYPVWSYADRSGTGRASLEAGTVPTRWGPLSAADRDFLVKVRLAGLWELPAGQQAIERAPTQAIRDCGDHLVVGHTDLDRRARDVAAKLGVELPNQPNAQQQGWLGDLTAARGMTYQREFVNILRMSHGRVFGLIAQIRASTRNSLIRRLADAANATVLDHMTMLERTGLVDFDAMAADAVTSSTAGPTGPPPPTTTLIPSPVPVVPSAGVRLTSKPSAAPPDAAAADPAAPQLGGTRHAGMHMH